jgi:hypothetical protein
METLVPQRDDRVREDDSGINIRGEVMPVLGELGGAQEFRAARSDAGGSTPPSGNNGGGGPFTRTGQPSSDVFRINLTHESISRSHEVDRHLPVIQVVNDAVWNESLNITSLKSSLRSATGGCRGDCFGLWDCWRCEGHRPGKDAAHSSQMSFTGGFGGSKILGTFKLPKFDGNARQWKSWHKTFIRYLSIHQLDFVIEESFLDSLPLTPRDFGANKKVHYILEDTITPGSIAAKYFRQAAKWNGNEAYAKLFNRFVSSGPQTMADLVVG